MKRKYVILSFLLLSVQQSFAQENPGARQIALSHAAVTLSSDPFSLFNNPAGLASIKSEMAGIYYSPSPFGLRELANGYGAYSRPSSAGTFSGGFMIYGFELYKETKISLGFGKEFSEDFSAGITAAYKSISIKNYGSTGVILFNAGAIVRLHDGINLGFALENFTRSTINDEDNQIPVVYWAGLSYAALNELQIYAAVKKEINFDASFRFGTEYLLLEFLQLRFGAATEPDTYSCGVGILYNIFRFDYAVSSHVDLGFTHQFGLIAKF